jgi:hypothetical protein
VIQQNETPMQLNQKDAEMLIAQGTNVGSWQVLPYQAPVVAIHMALLRTGRVFLIGGSSLDPNNRLCPNCSAVWNVSNGTFTRPTTPNDNAGIVIDLFCAGHSFRSDGQLFVAGGTQQYNPYKGSTAALLFNPSTEQWTRLPSMNRGRWYPTVVTLGNGRNFVLSGLNTDGNGLERNAEIYVGSSGWNLFSQPTASPFPMYAGLILMQSGRLFFSGSNFEDVEGATPRIITLPSQFTQAITEQAVPGLTNANSRNQAATVLLPPAQDQRVMIIGGGTNNSYGTATTNSVNIVDLKVSNPTYTAGPSLNFGRMHHEAVLLPDRTVLVCNGTTIGEDDTQPIPPTEIYNPAMNTWTVVATQNVRRRYHGTAILLPDGRVVSAGSAAFFGLENHDFRLEIYSPPYISQPRPVIQQAPTSVRYGNTLTLTISRPQSVPIKWVSLISPMATTHSLDTSQRVVDVPIASQSNTSLTTGAITTNRNLAPPGYYMLFITNQNNVPSVARWIRLRT